MQESQKKVLLMRFSALGDVLQSLSLIGAFAREWPEAEIHFVTRSDFAPLVESHPHLHRIWKIKKGDGFLQIIKLARQLRSVGFTHVYDPHNNLRSRILCVFLAGVLGWRKLFLYKFLRRPIFRFKRFLLFNFRYNTFPKPFNGQGAMLTPLKKWKLNPVPPPAPQLFLPSPKSDLLSILPQHFIALAPSAAHPLKRWPLDYFDQLIELLPEIKFVCLGGPEDGFVNELQSKYPSRVISFVGMLSYVESAQVVKLAKLLISNDTGVMHMAEQLGIPCIALMGPAPFGFPSRSSTIIKERNLPCRPCSKHGQGPCVNKEFQKCLRDILPNEVAQDVVSILRQRNS